MSIRQLMLVGVLSVVLAACPAPMGACEQNSDCATGGVCDSSCNCCLYPESDGGNPDGGGQDGGTDQCTPECAEYQQCVGTTCEARYSAVVIESPANGARAKKGEAVQVTAKLTLAAGKSANPPAQLMLRYTPPGGPDHYDVALSPSNGGYAGSFTAEKDGVYQLVASYPDTGLTSPTVELVSDGVAPTFTVTVDPAPTRLTPVDGTTWTDTLDAAYATAYRRDEIATIHVSSEDDDVKGDGVTVEVKVGSDASTTRPVASVAAAECGASAKWCGTAEVKLWELEMNAFRGEFTVTAAGTDVVGNSGTSAPASGKVTRFKWVHQANGAPEISGTPVIGVHGRVIFGTKSGGSSGSVVALKHDGSFGWAKPVGAIAGSPSVGENSASGQALYVAGKDSSGPALWALDVVDGTELTQSPCRIANGTAVEASIAVLKTQFDMEPAPVETATTVINGVGRLLSIRPGSVSDECKDATGAGSLDFPSAVAANGDSVTFADSGGNIRGYDFDTMTGWGSKFTPVPGSLGTRALAFDGTDWIAARGTGLVAVSQAGVAGWAHSTTSPTWLAVIGDLARIYVGLGDNQLLSVTSGLSASEQIASFTNFGAVKAAPLLGQGEWLYAAGNDGTLVARRTVSFSTNAWNINGLEDVKASLNIDCSRDANGQKRPGAPGVLYVANTAGKLYALIVDSRGIDTTAPWPKYQHDPRNTGNADTSLGEFSCN